jgi:hypothetical protein
MSSSSSVHRLVLIPDGETLTPEEGSLAKLLGVQGDPLTPEGIPPALPEGGGWILVPARFASSLSLRLLLEFDSNPDPWAFLVIEPDGEARVLSVSPGFSEPVEVAEERLSGSTVDGGFLNHRGALLALSRIRHDVNNALTSAMAETQFMRMDAEAGTELSEGLELVENQLRRIRDLVGELSGLRVTPR